MACRVFKDLPRRTASDKVLGGKGFNIAKNPKYDGYERDLAPTVEKVFDKKIAGGAFKNEIMQNKELVVELHKPFIRKFEKRKVHSSFIGNIWGVDLADMQLLSKFKRGIRFSLCVIDIYSKYAWASPFKDKKGITITNAFQKFLDESRLKPNKIWIDKGSKFYNRSVKSWLKNKGIEIYSTHNEGTSAVADRFIRALKNKIYKYITSVSKKMYIGKLDDIVDKYNHKYHSTYDVKSSKYIDFDKKNF